MATPFHSTEKCFRRYERVIAAITKRFPSETRFRCTKRRATTDAARLQDAMTSYRMANWHTEEIDRRKFVDEVYRNIIITPVAEEVIVSPRRPPQVEIVQVSQENRVAGSLDSPNQKQIDTAIQAIELSVVQWPIQLTNLSQEQIDYIKAIVDDCFNVAFTQEGTTIILV